MTCDFYGDQQQQRDNSDDCENDTVVEHSSVSYPVPQHPGHDAGDELQQPHCCVVPADAAGAQTLRHELRSESLADSAENPLVQPIK